MTIRVKKPLKRHERNLFTGLAGRIMGGTHQQRVGLGQQPQPGAVLIGEGVDHRQSGAGQQADK